MILNSELQYLQTSLTHYNLSSLKLLDLADKSGSKLVAVNWLDDVLLLTSN